MYVRYLYHVCMYDSYVFQLMYEFMRVCYVRDSGNACVCVYVCNNVCYVFNVGLSCTLRMLLYVRFVMFVHNVFYVCMLCMYACLYVINLCM